MGRMEPNRYFQVKNENGSCSVLFKKIISNVVEVYEHKKLRDLTFEEAEYYAMKLQEIYNEDLEVLEDTQYWIDIPFNLIYWEWLYTINR